MEVLLVNKNHPLPNNYVPEDLIYLKDLPGRCFTLYKDHLMLNKEAADMLNLMLHDAANDNYTDYRINSAYRTREVQTRIYKSSTSKAAAAPGQSEHETGLAIDIVGIGGYIGQTEWLALNCYKYGYILRYPEFKEDITGFPYEPWHFRYVGVEAANYLEEHRICLEEYFEEKYDIPVVRYEIRKATNEIDKPIWDFLISKINNPCGVAGLMGNLFAESSMRSAILQYEYQDYLGYNSEEYTNAVDKGKYTNFVSDCAGYGIAQWTLRSRKEKLLSYAKSHNKSIGDMNMQLEFLIHELSTDYPGVYNILLNATSIQEASDAVLTKFENPELQSTAVKQKRATDSRRYLCKYINKDQLGKQLEALSLWREDITFLLMDYDTDQILYEKNADIIRSIGSITKSMSAYVLAPHIFGKDNKLQDLVTIDKEAAKMSNSPKDYSGNEHFHEGEKVPIDTLLRLSLIPSGCASTLALAKHFYGTSEAFVKKMNEVSKSLGMSAHFEDVIGVNPFSAASARDLAILTKAIVQDAPEILNYTSQKKVVYKGIVYHGTNRTIVEETVKGADGIKTGSTPSAGKCILSTAKRRNHRVIAVVLNAQEYDERNTEVELLLEYGLAKMETYEYF